ncbi:MAG: 50S ribosomal protein L11 methyltransferase [Candidatus Obscuribacterales bacterium]
MQQQQRQKRTWAVVEVTIQPQEEDMAGWLFMQLGATGCEFLPETGSGTVTLRATFESAGFDASKVQSINSALDEYGLAKCLGSMRTAELVEEDWLAKWKEGFHPFDVGTRLIVTPPWAVKDLSAERRGTRHLVIIEPGLAFGTGFHATTRFCLESIEKFLRGERILDVGTGSGILAIAAAKLFPDKQITAVETDSIACDVARENFAINQVESTVQLICGSTDDIPPNGGAGGGGGERPRYSTILSNLTAEDNAFLMPDYGEHLLADGGVLIMAGILTEKVDRVLTAAAAQKLTVAYQAEDGMWTGLVVTKS